MAPDLMVMTVLSPREQQVFELLKSGVRANDIALRLKLSQKTVSTFKVRIREKLGMSNEELEREILSGGDSLRTLLRSNLAIKSEGKLLVLQFPFDGDAAKVESLIRQLT